MLFSINKDDIYEIRFHIHSSQYHLNGAKSSDLFTSDPLLKSTYSISNECTCIVYCGLFNRVVFVTGQVNETIKFADKTVTVNCMSYFVYVFVRITGSSTSSNRKENLTDMGPKIRNMMRDIGAMQKCLISLASKFLSPPKSFIY